MADSLSADTSPETWQRFLDAITHADSQPALDAVEQDLFGRKHGAMTLALKALGMLSQEERMKKGQELNEWKKKITESLTARAVSLKQTAHAGLAETDPLDVTLELPTQERGYLHPIPEFMRQVEEVFGRMGFDVAYGNEVETEQYNFDLLNFPKHHAARDAQDVFYLDLPSEPDDRWLLRAHTSPVQIHYMQSHKPPFRMICPGKVYRKDSDATHSPMFHQFEGLMVGPDVSLANMKAVMITAIRELIDLNAEFRFRTGYFPFVEPGLEVDMTWQGDMSKSREGKWLEIGGCGMVHPNVLQNCGIDPEKYQGFAFGFGVERMIMIKQQIPDLRTFYQGDVRFLRQF